MSQDAYREFVFEVQALRRRVERDLHLGGALGVAGTLWPHQVANVALVLRDTAVRHVLADEVGLGKTVQAIMIMKALLLQRDLRVCIVVPNHLKDQWAREVMARANLAVVQDEPLEGDDRRPLLIWPESRHAGTDLTGFDLLIIDELPRLRGDVQQRILAASVAVQHLLVLTATPPLDDPARARQLFELIEPVRAALADGDVMNWFRQREREAAELLDAGWSEDAGPGVPPEPQRETAALAYASTRRMLRTRRDVWHEYLPLREKHVRVVEPTAAERRRQDLLWRWFKHKDELTREFDITLVAQRVRSPATFRQRTTWLRGHGHDRNGLIEAAARTLDGNPGDSRFEALLDLLLDVWGDDPGAQVLIAAGDNKTIEELEKGLSRAFDAMRPSGEPLSIASIYNQTKGEKEELFVDDPVAEAARRFRDGAAQVLLLAEAGAAGLNLQCARHIVLYAIPWDPTEVEQLIGRVDRIGNPATKSKNGPRPIEVHIVAQAGLVDHRVVQVIEATGILEHSLSLDGQAVDMVRRRIEEVGLRDDPAAWPTLVAEARALGARREAEDLELPLLGHLPTSPDRAYGLATRLTGMPVCAPALGKPGPREEGWADAARTWLKAMRTAGKYRFHSVNSGAGVSLLAYNYTLPANTYRSPGQLGTRPLGELPRVGSRAYLRTHRHSLESEPPLRWEDDERPLYFFDHGSPLHEDVLRAWFEVNARKRSGLFVPDGHRCARLVGAVVRLRTAWLDAGRLLPEPRVPHPEIEADARFLRGVLPSALLMVGVVLRKDGPAALPLEDVAALLAPDPDGPLLAKPAPEWKSPTWLSPMLEGEADTLALQHLQQLATERWTPRWGELEQAIAGRRYVLTVDAADADELFERRRTEAVAAAAAAELEGRRLAAGNAVKRKEELVATARANDRLNEARDEWLGAVASRSPTHALAHFNDAWLLIQR